MLLHGYVGYDDGRSLVDKVRKKPYCVVLFDEIEKANEEVLNILLQILEDGKLTDSNGNIANFQETLIILTSNIGADIMNGKNEIGFKSYKKDFKKEEVFNELKKYLRPELLNRIDEICIFNHLSKESMHKIFRNKFEEFKNVLEEQNIFVEVSDNLENFIIDKSDYFNYGARSVRREIEQNIEDIIVDEMISRNIKGGEKLFLDYDNVNKKVFIK